MLICGMGEKKAVLIEGSQASPALPSDKSGVEVKELGLLRDMWMRNFDFLN
jgi:hypothetical protein